MYVFELCSRVCIYVCVCESTPRHHRRQCVYDFIYDLSMIYRSFSARQQHATLPYGTLSLEEGVEAVLDSYFQLGGSCFRRR